MVISQFSCSSSLYAQVCGVEFDRKDILMNKLVATCLESKIHVFDMRTQHPKKGFSSLTEKVSSLLEIVDVIICIHTNSAILIFNYSNYLSISRPTSQQFGRHATYHRIAMCSWQLEAMAPCTSGNSEYPTVGYFFLGGQGAVSVGVLMATDRSDLHIVFSCQGLVLEDQG